MPNQLDVLSSDEIPGFGSAQQTNFFSARAHETRGRLRQRLVNVSRVHHELGDAGAQILTLLFPYVPAGGELRLSCGDPGQKAEVCFAMAQAAK